MTHAVYEFPINEKVRTYLRLEQLFKQLDQSQSHEQDWQYIGFFESFFTLLDLLERVDLRTDILKDIDAHEKNLVYWSQHPKIDNDALQQALRHILDLRERLKNAGKVGATLKEDRFLKSIRQRFAIPGGTCSFDLPNLHFWLRQSQKQKHPSSDLTLSRRNFWCWRGTLVGDPTAMDFDKADVVRHRHSLMSKSRIDCQLNWPILISHRL